MQEERFQAAGRDVGRLQRRTCVHDHVDVDRPVIALGSETERDSRHYQHHDEDENSHGCHKHDHAPVQQTDQGTGVAFTDPFQGCFGPSVQGRGEPLGKAEEHPHDVVQQGEYEGVQDQRRQRDEVLHHDQPGDENHARNYAGRLAPRPEAPFHGIPRRCEARRQVAPILGAVGFRCICHAHREEQDCLQEGEKNGRGKAEGKLPEEAANDAAHEADGDQHGKQREGGGHNRAEYFAGSLEHGLPLAEAHRPVAFHVFRHDDRVVHDDSDGDDHGEHGYQVQGEAAEVVENGGRGERDRNREDHGESGVELAQEEQDDEGNHDRGDEYLPVRGVQRSLDGRGGVVAEEDRIALRQLRLRDERADVLHDRHGVGGRGLLYGHQHRGVAVYARIVGRDRQVADGGHIAHPDASDRVDERGGDFSRVCEDVLGGEGERVVVTVDRADRLVDGGGGDRRDDLLRREVERLQAVRVQENLELTARPAVDLDVRHPRNAHEKRRELVGHVCADVPKVGPRARDAELKNGNGLGIECLYDGRTDANGQLP